ncbi:MAG: hypothetical protein HDT28_08655 [Clostridiales bacterium]|nr:hypothetical protein [Clostridiales bacterium]
MKNPHDTSEYKKLDDGVLPEPEPETATATDEAVGEADGAQAVETADGATKAKKKDKKQKLSGAYYYVDKDEQKLKDMAFARTMLCVIGFMLQFVVLLLPQGGLEYVTYNIPSLAYAYMWAVFVLVGIAIWLFIMIKLRYKIAKRIVKEYAPKNGFKRRAYFGSELFIAINAVIFLFELSFVCIHYDGIGLVGMFITALAVGCAVAARVITQQTLKNAELIEAKE